jgi:SAM-dependent methyltransferase
MIRHKECPVCSSANISFLLSAADHFVSKEEFPVYNCNSCSFKFTQDIPEGSEIGKYYESEDYISHSDISKSFSDKLYRLARNLMLRKKENLVISLTDTSNGNLLDIGSGTGYFANRMKSSGWNVKGIEINQKARDFSVSHFGLDVVSPDQISSIESGNYDCITLWHVLEHFHDPFNYASEIFRMLKVDGICIVALPNSNSFDSKHYGKYWAAWDVPRHLWHFNPSTLSLFAEKAGFLIKEIHALPLDVFYISLLSEKYKGSSFAFFSGMVKGLWFSIRVLFRKYGSSSLIYILQKK